MLNSFSFTMLFLTLINLFLLIFLLRFDRSVYKKNVFSPGSIFIYFSIIPAISNLYFSIFQVNFYEIVLLQVDIIFRNYLFVNIALFLTIIGNCVTYFGIYYGSKSKIIFLSYLMNKIFFTKYTGYQSIDFKSKNKFIYKFGIIVYISGILVYFIFVQKIGGLFQIWEELELRSVKNAGLGYFQTYYMFAIQLGAMIILWYAFIKSFKFVKIITFLLTIFILGSMGARGPIIIFLLSTIIMYHYLIKPFKKIFTVPVLIFALLIPIFIVVMLQFRTYSYSYLRNNLDVLVENSISSFESGFVARIGRLERDIVILQYFEKNDYWLGKSFYGLIVAPIPRSIYPSKPPNDTGMYLRMMALNQKVDPPMPISELGNSSWPEGNWVGYMNYGLLGFLFFFYFSGLLFGKFYNYLSKNGFQVLPTCSFAILAVGGPPILSPLGIISLMMFFFFTFIFILFFFLPAKIK